MQIDACEYKYQLDNQFFEDLDAPEIQKGKLDVLLHVKKTSGVYLLEFRIEGMVVVTCDRCLDEMEQSIVSTDTLKVKLGDEFSDNNDVVVIPEEDGYINVAWFIYEFIALNIPMRHMHEYGKCNGDMMNKLNKYLKFDEDNDDDLNDGVTQKMDPRWNELKKILDNN